MFKNRFSVGQLTALFCICLVLWGAAPPPAQAKPPIPPAADTSLAPPCRLGTDWAVNPGRQMAEGESEWTLPSPQVATVSQRESAGSSRIVLRRCMVPAGTVIVRGGTAPWIRICGNAVFPEGWVIPLPAGPQGPKGESGADGLPGKDGRDGIDGSDGAQGRDGNDGTVGPLGPHGKSGGKKWAIVALAVAGAALGAAFAAKGQKQSQTVNVTVGGGPSKPSTQICRQGPNNQLICE